MQKLMRYPDLVEAGVVNNRVTLARWIKHRGFPKPIQLGANSVAWPADQVEAWIAALPTTDQKEAA